MSAISKATGASRTTAGAPSRPWLSRLASPDWEAVYEAPFGPITAGAIFAAWGAPDLLHMRRLVELRWANTVRLASPYQVEYAGSW